MCPEPALLVAYLDGTLFHRDARAVDDHVLTCASCTGLLADMRRQREAELQRSRRSHARTIGIAVAAIAIVALGVWAVMPGSKSTASPDVAPARSDAPPAVVSAASPSPALEPTRPVAPEKTPTPTSAPKPAATTKPVSRAPEKPAREETVRDPETPAVGDGGIVLRGGNANRRVMWRVRDLVIEHSTDGGATWVTEHTADRRIRAGAFVNASVAGLVGENGLVLRRTINGWFGASPPADEHITAVRASSPSTATVTLEDGRVFNTQNGGVTWSTP